jgi:m7GpppX diphosphatase
MVTETPEIYTKHIRPYMLRQREEGRLNWVFNIIEGRTEQEDVILRDHGGTGDDGEGFLLLPDLNWDRKTMTSLHLLALVERRDIWSLRDLTKRHVGWLRRMRQHVLEATTKVYPGIEEDELKLYVHCEYPGSPYRILDMLWSVDVLCRPTNILSLPHPHRARHA